MTEPKPIADHSGKPPIFKSWKTMYFFVFFLLIVIILLLYIFTRYFS